MFRKTFHVGALDSVGEDGEDGGGVDSDIALLVIAICAPSRAKPSQVKSCRAKPSQANSSRAGPSRAVSSGQPKSSQIPHRFVGSVLTIAVTV